MFTTPARAADPQPSTRPALELGRYDRIRREHQGFPASQPAPGLGGPEPREPIAVLADVLSRDGAELSATQTWRRNLANADHLATLHAIWTAEIRDARHDRYRALVMAALPSGHRGELSHRARWLYRTLHAAELADLDPADVIRTAITSRDLAGSRDIAAVLDARIRPRLDPLLPQPLGSWTSRVPRLPDPARRAYLTGIAALMDDRTRRLGQHTAQTAPGWGHHRARPGTRRPVHPAGLGTQGRPHRGVSRDVRLRPSRRPDRPRTQPTSPGPTARAPFGAIRVGLPAGAASDPRNQLNRRTPAHPPWPEAGLQATEGSMR